MKTRARQWDAYLHAKYICLRSAFAHITSSIWMNVVWETGTVQKLIPISSHWLRCFQMFSRTCSNSRRFHQQACIFISNEFHIRKALSAQRFTLSANERHQDSAGRSYTSSIRPGETQYRLIEDVEDLNGYCPGGYHPVWIGDKLHDGRYEIVHKLGYGGYSTIWLACDLQF